MHVHNSSHQNALRLPGSIAHWIMGIALTFLLVLSSNAAFAAATAAGTSIGNQASATYQDSTGATQTVTSNTVQTVVQQVAALALVSNGAKTATAGSIVYYPHILTNTGNGTDTYALSVTDAGTGFAMPGALIYADNGSGQPTGPAITSTGALAAGASFKFVVAATVPTTATSGQTNSQTVTGTSGFTPAQKLTNSDTTTVTGNAVINLTKSISVSSGGPGTAATYTLTYTNTGNSTATAVKVTDTIPTGMTYTPGSGLWSVTGVTALTDATGDLQGTAPNTVDYSVTGTTVTAIVAQVAPGQSGTISFKVSVGTTTAPGTISNTANVSYNDGSGSTVNGVSNTVPFTVGQTAGVTLTAPAAVASASPGSTVSFANVITNNGTGTDTFNMTLSAGNFPAGTSFVLYKSDNSTPLIDTNGDGIPDTGPLAAGASYTVYVHAVLPASATGTGPFTVNKTATSTVNPSVASTGADTLSAVTSASVDVTNNAKAAAGVPGYGPGPEATAQVTNTANPGTSTAFILFVNNTGPIADNYNLTSTQPLPAGWTLTFKADGGVGNCSTTGATITNTGTVAAAGNALVCAVVTVPAGFAAGTSDLYFMAKSPVTNAADAIHDAVAVNALRSLTYTPNGTGQVFPGGSVVYSHTLTNTGNVTEGNGTLSTITLPSVNAQAGWTSTLYYDANNNGVLDATDPAIPAAGLQSVLAAGLAPGKSITIFDKVIAPSGVAIGVVNTTTMTVNTANGTNPGTAPATVVATDSTTVVAGNVTLIKTQGLDAGCTGTPPGGYSTNAITTGAVPGACIDYKVTVQNVGAANANGVVVSDATPAYTLMSALPVPAVTQGSITAPATGATGPVTASVGILTPSQSAVVTFGVKIQ